MTTLQGAGQNYFSEFLPVPDRLNELFEAVKLLLARHKQSSFSCLQRRQLLMEGASTPAIFAQFVDDVYPTFPDCRSVKRISSAIVTYLDRLIAPDELASAREPIADRLGIDDRDEIADDLCTLDSVAPEIATALLELRIGKAERLFGQYLSRSGRGHERETLEDCRHLPEGMARLRSAYLLRCEAMKSGARIHAHFGWPVLDDLESLGTGGCLRVSTLLKRVEREMALVEHVLVIYRDPTSDAALPHRLLTYPAPVAPTGTATALPPGLRLLDALNIEGRAHVQQAIWRMQHGPCLEALVRAKVEEITEYLTRMKASIESYRGHHANAIVANLGRANPGVQLYLAVREAVAWTRDSTGKDGINAASPVVTALATCAKHGGAQGDIPLPKLKLEDANTIDELFVIYRIAFLQDNEVLPGELRRVVDPATGRRRQVKSHDHAAMILGRRYTFTEQWEAWKRSITARKAKLSADATKKQLLQAQQIDLAAKRDAFKILKRRGRRMTPVRGAFDSRDALRTGILRGFMTT